VATVLRLTVGRLLTLMGGRRGLEHLAISKGCRGELVDPTNRRATRGRIVSPSGPADGHGLVRVSQARRCGGHCAIAIQRRMADGQGVQTDSQLNTGSGSISGGTSIIDAGQNLRDGVKCLLRGWEGMMEPGEEFLAFPVVSVRSRVRAGHAGFSSILGRGSV